MSPPTARGPPDRLGWSSATRSGCRSLAGTAAGHRVPALRPLDHLRAIHEDCFHPLAKPRLRELEVSRADTERQVMHPVEAIAGLEDEAAGPDRHRDPAGLWVEGPPARQAAQAEPTPRSSPGLAAGQWRVHHRRPGGPVWRGPFDGLPGRGTGARAIDVERAIDCDTLTSLAGRPVKHTPPGRHKVISSTKQRHAADRSPYGPPVG